MSAVTISPHPLIGEFHIPTNKSFAHRAIILSSLSGASSVLHVPVCDDVTSTASAVSALGAELSFDGGTVSVSRPVACVHKNDAVIDCMESASTLRMLIPVAAALGINTEFIRAESLTKRSISPIVDALTAHGVSVIEDMDSVFVRGHLMPCDITVDASASSQFVSGLLMAMSIFGEPCILTVTGEAVSRPYITMTLDVLRAYGVEISVSGGKYEFGKCSLHPADLTCPVDFSSALPFITAGITGDCFLPELSLDCTDQADAIAVRAMKSAGAGIYSHKNGISVRKTDANLTPFDFDASDCPDSVPCLAIFAAVCGGDSTIYGVDRLRGKESDRVDGTISLLSAFGVAAEYNNGHITVHGSPAHQTTDTVYFRTHDHRLAMAAAAGAKLLGRYVTIDGSECVSKSFPDFYDIFGYEQD